MPGIRKISWRDRLRKMLFPACPMLWKKWLTTICPPTSGNIITQMRNPRAAMDIICSSLVNSMAGISGMNMPMRKPSVVTTVPAAMV